MTTSAAADQRDRVDAVDVDGSGPSRSPGRRAAGRRCRPRARVALDRQRRRTGRSWRRLTRSTTASGWTRFCHLGTMNTTLSRVGASPATRTAARAAVELEPLRRPAQRAPRLHRRRGRRWRARGTTAVVLGVEHVRASKRLRSRQSSAAVGQRAPASRGRRRVELDVQAVRQADGARGRSSRAATMKLVRGWCGSRSRRERSERDDAARDGAQARAASSRPLVARRAGRSPTRRRRRGRGGAGQQPRTRARSVCRSGCRPPDRCRWKRG